MLRDIAAGGADRSFSPPAVHDFELGPRVTGANVVDVGLPSEKPRAPSKRTHSEFKSEGVDAEGAHEHRFDQRMWMKMSRPPIFRPRKCRPAG